MTARGTRTVNVVISSDDYDWLKDKAEHGPYLYPSTLARYMLAEKIQEERVKDNAADEEEREESNSSDKREATSSNE